MEKAIDLSLYLWLMISLAVSGSYCQTISPLKLCVLATSNVSTPIDLQPSDVTSITTPRYPSPYYGNMDFNWTITAPVSYVLRLKVVDFQLEDIKNNRCPADMLSIYDPADSSNDKDLCGTRLSQVAVVCTQANTAFIRFRTDGDWCYRGFNMTIEVLSTNQAHTECSQNITTTITTTWSQSTSAPYAFTTLQSATVRNSLPTSSTSSHGNLSSTVLTDKTEGPKGSSGPGAIVGGVVGGLLAAGLLVGLFVFLKYRVFRRSPATVEAKKEPPSDHTDETTTTALFSPPQLIREPTCAPAATFPVPRPLTAAPKHPPSFESQ